MKHKIVTFTKTAIMKKLLFITALFCFIASAYGQQLSTAQIDALVQHSLKAFDVPGISVGIIKDGKIIYAKGNGVRSLKTQLPADENTIYGVASNSKAFTCTALGMLVDEGKIKWDDKVRDYIPEFKLYSPYVTEAFTIRDMLTHRSGLGLGAGDLMFFPDSSDFVLKDIIYNLRFLKQVSEFRTKYDYDNLMYILAGEIVHRVSGISWDDFIEQKIFKPLGMEKSAGSFDRLKDKSNVIDAHAPVNGKVQVIARSTVKVGHSAGGINSNISELCKWVQLWLNHGKYGDGLSKRLFSENVYREITSPQTIMQLRNPGPYNTHFLAYGLGFRLSDEKGYKIVTHTGGLEGMVTQITMIPELNLGIIVLTNQQEGGAFISITNQIKDAYFGIIGTNRVEEYSKGRKEQVAMANKLVDSIWKEIQSADITARPDINLYTGTYHDVWFGDIYIAVKNGKLWFTSKRSPKLNGEMFYYKGNSFVVKWQDRSMDADAFVNFSLDEQGKADGIKMRAISPLTDFSYDFHDLDFSRVK